MSCCNVKGNHPPRTLRETEISSHQRFMHACRAKGTDRLSHSTIVQAKINAPQKDENENANLFTSGFSLLDVTKA